jgi:hypothetical protein
MKSENASDACVNREGNSHRHICKHKKTEGLRTTCMNTRCLGDGPVGCDPPNLFVVPG